MKGESERECAGEECVNGIERKNGGGTDRQAGRQGERQTGEEDSVEPIVGLFPLLSPHACSPQSCDLVAPSVGSAALQKAQPVC